MKAKDDFCLVASASIAPFVPTAVRANCRKALDGSGEYLISRELLVECLIDDLLVEKGCTNIKTADEARTEIANNQAKWVE